MNIYVSTNKWSLVNSISHYILLIPFNSALLSFNCFPCSSLKRSKVDCTAKSLVEGRKKCAKRFVELIRVVELCRTRIHLSESFDREGLTSTLIPSRLSSNQAVAVEAFMTSLWDRSSTIVDILLTLRQIIALSERDRFEEQQIK